MAGNGRWQSIGPLDSLTIVEGCSAEGREECHCDPGITYAAVDAVLNGIRQ